MKSSVLRSGLGLLVSLPAGTALAADLGGAPPPPRTETSRLYDVVMEVGLGAALQPAYEGAKDYEVSPTGFVTVKELWLPMFGQVKDGRVHEGWSFGPSFRYVTERDASDYSALHGLNNIDAAFELGGKVAYTFGWLRPSVAVRQGFGGHDGVVGEVALEGVFYPTAQTEFTIGPRASFASSDYMQTYFGVTHGESMRSGLAAYKPGGGFKSVGVQATGKYRFTPEWAVYTELEYARLIGDAADSPIVEDGGSADQFTGKLGVSYTFGMKLFDR